jgi:hypothetical protein
LTYEVDDYGSAFVGTGTIDLYKPSRSMMNNWGVRHVDIEVIQWGSYERSMQLMRDRTKWKHVRAMMEGIEARLRTAGMPEGGRSCHRRSLNRRGLCAKWATVWRLRESKPNGPRMTTNKVEKPDLRPFACDSFSFALVWKPSAG